MGSGTAPARPDGFLWIGRLLHAALDIDSRSVPGARPRSELPAFRVMFTLVRQDLDAGGNGVQPLYNLAVTASLAVGYLIREASRHFGREPDQVAVSLAGQLITDHVGRVLATVFDGTFDDVLARVLSEGEPEAFFDVVGDLAALAAVLVLGVADREGVGPDDLVERLQTMAEESC